jgi:hypothetical protein
MVFQVVPAGPERTLETWDFFFETAELESAEIESVRYIDDVLQVQDINLVESVQRGMRTPAFDQGRIVCDPAGSGLSEHGVHHFHGLVLDAYRALVQRDVPEIAKLAPAVAATAWGRVMARKLRHREGDVFAVPLRESDYVDDERFTLTVRRSAGRRSRAPRRAARRPDRPPD